ncbi:MAG: CopG family transcriptional regulator, partial [Acidobacteria bacterium]
MKRPKEEHDFSRARRGAVVPIPPGKTRITIRIDTDILKWFRRQVHAAGGGNYQTLMNEALRQHIERREENLED